MIDTPVYLHESFQSLVYLLFKLDVFDVKVHRVSPWHMMNGRVPDTWIPGVHVGLEQHYIEVIRFKKAMHD